MAHVLPCSPESPTPADSNSSVSLESDSMLPHLVLALNQFKTQPPLDLSVPNLSHGQNISEVKTYKKKFHNISIFSSSTKEQDHTPVHIPESTLGTSHPSPLTFYREPLQLCICGFAQAYPSGLGILPPNFLASP